jgi:hypothetical protein
MHDTRVHQTKLVVVKPIWTAFSYDGFHMNMSSAFDTGGEEGSEGGGVRVGVWYAKGYGGGVGS